MSDIRYLGRWPRCHSYGTQPLRVFGLAGIAIALAGCDPTLCHEGELYSDPGRDGIYIKHTRDGKPVRCVVPEPDTPEEPTNE